MMLSLVPFLTFIFAISLKKDCPHRKANKCYVVFFSYIVIRQMQSFHVIQTHFIFVQFWAVFFIIKYSIVCIPVAVTFSQSQEIFLNIVFLSILCSVLSLEYIRYVNTLCYSYCPKYSSPRDLNVLLPHCTQDSTQMSPQKDFLLMTLYKISSLSISFHSIVLLYFFFIAHLINSTW